MKYKPEDYIESGFYSDDTEIENHIVKVVRCRKPHKCANCQKQIEIGDYALAESGFMDGKPVRCYTCLPCIDEWLDEINEQTTTKVKYPKFCVGGDYVPGAGAKRKGSAGERELVNILKEAGVEAQRVPLSGSVDGYSGDVYLPELNKRVEVKRRKNGLKTVYDWLAQNSDVSYLAFRIDRQPWIVAMSLEEFISLLNGDGND